VSKLPLYLSLLLAPFASAFAQKAAPSIPADTEIQTTASGLKYSVLSPGQGTRTPRVGEPVLVHCTKWLPDGTLVDTSRRSGQPLEFVVGEKKQLLGLEEGVHLMAKGSKYKLTLPYGLAYGEQGLPPTIPARSELILEVELLDFIAFPDYRPADPAAQKKTASGLVYEVISEGEGDAPKQGASVKLKYALWTAEGKLVDCSEAKGWRIEGPVGRLAFPFTTRSLAFANEAAQLLKPGARYRFEVPAELAFGAKEQGPSLPPNSATVWELENPAPSGPKFALTEPDKLQKTASGLGYEVLREGTGRAPKATDRVIVNYAGWLASGKPFDSSYDRGQPATFGLGEVIRGWTEGVQLMKEGGMYRFTIPPELGWGADGFGNMVPPNATVVFVIELLSIAG